MKVYTIKERKVYTIKERKQTKNRLGIETAVHHYRHGVMVIVIGNGHDDLSSNPEQDWLHFT